MKPKAFLALAGITVLTAAGAAITTVSSTVGSAVAERGTAFLPDLISKANGITRMTIRSGSQTTAIELKNGSFEDASGFPVKPDPVRDLVTSLSILRIEEKKTADPVRYSELDLADPGSETGSGKTVTLEGKDGQKIADVVVGRTDGTVGGTSGGQFIRKTGDKQSYLARGSVKLPLSRSGWFDTRLYQTGNAKIERATLMNAEGTKIGFTFADDKLKLDTPPEDSKADDAKLDRLLRVIRSIDFEDVRKARDEAGPIGARLIFETESGLSVTIGALGMPDGSSADSEQQWVQISALARKDTAKPELEKLTARLSGYEFRLRPSDNEILGWTMKDLTQKAPQS